ncbi:MAG: TonB-dependent receptor [Gemmatimonadota bacterium]
MSIRLSRAVASLHKAFRTGCVLGAISPFARTAVAQESTPATQSLDSLLSVPVSTGARYAQQIRQVSGSVSIVTAEDIRRFGYHTLEDVLQSLAGLYASYDRSYTQIGARGFNRPSDFNNRILLLVDGHTTNEGIWGSAMLGDELALNLDAVDRIEVVRGPASALYGTGAMFAVINVISRPGVAINGARGGLSGGNFGRQSATVSGGFDLADHRDIAFSAMMENRDGRDLYFPEFNAPSTSNGIAHNLDYQRRVGGLLSLRLGDLKLSGKYNDRLKGDPTAAYGQNFNDQLSHIRDASGHVEALLEHELSAVSHLTARTYYDNYFYEGSYPFVGDLNTDHGSNKVIGAESALRWDPTTRNRVTVGAEYRWNARSRYQSWDQGFLSSTIDRPFTVISLYLQNDLQIRHDLSLLVGVRHDENSIVRGATTPRIAVIYDPNPGTTLKAMYGRAFRAPSLVESAYPQAGFDLGPERLNMGEGIWMQRLGGRALLSTSFYQYRVHGLIDAVRDSNGVLSYRNLGEVNARGLETTLDLRPAPGLRGYVNYSLGRAVDDRGNRLSNSPSSLLKLGFAADISRRASAAIEMRYESGRIALDRSSTRAFVIANLNIGVHPFATRSGPHRLDGVDVGLRIANLFDAHYAYPGGAEHVQTAIPQDGRGILVRLGYEF